MANDPPPPDDRDAPKETAASKYRRRQLERQLGPTQFLDMAPPLAVDTLWRGLARSGEARVLVVRATAAVREAAARLQASPDVAGLLGELILAGLLVRSTLNPEARLQLYLRHDGPVGTVVVDVWDGGGVRAYAKVPTATRELGGELIGSGLMEVARTQAATAKSWRSTVALHGGAVDAILGRYLRESEQVLSLLHTEVALQGGEIASAVGWLVQLMPEGTREDLARVTANHAGIGALQAAMTAADPDGRAWAEALLAGFRWDQCARELVAYECRCSEARVLAMLATLPEDDLRELAGSAEPLEMTCDFCKTRYHVATARVAALLERPS